jgi:hypothetical protein
MEPEFLFAPENLQIELINLQRDTNLNQKFSETNLLDFHSCLPKEKFLCSDPLG